MPWSERNSVGNLRREIRKDGNTFGISEPCGSVLGSALDAPSWVLLSNSRAELALKILKGRDEYSSLFCRSLSG